MRKYGNESRNKRQESTIADNKLPLRHHSFVVGVIGPDSDTLDINFTNDTPNPLSRGREERTSAIENKSGRCIAPGSWNKKKSRRIHRYAVSFVINFLLYPGPGYIGQTNVSIYLHERLALVSTTKNAFGIVRRHTQLRYQRDVKTDSRHGRSDQMKGKSVGQDRFYCILSVTSLAGMQRASFLEEFDSPPGH